MCCQDVRIKFLMLYKYPMNFKCITAIEIFINRKEKSTSLLKSTYSHATTIELIHPSSKIYFNQNNTCQHIFEFRYQRIGLIVEQIFAEYTFQVPSMRRLEDHHCLLLKFSLATSWIVNDSSYTDQNWFILEKFKTWSKASFSLGFSIHNYIYFLFPIL